jgi:hypothetical protein
MAVPRASWRNLIEPVTSSRPVVLGIEISAGLGDGSSGKRKRFRGAQARFPAPLQVTRAGAAISFRSQHRQFSFSPSASSPHCCPNIGRSVGNVSSSGTRAYRPVRSRSHNHRPSCVGQTQLIRKLDLPSAVDLSIPAFGFTASRDRSKLKSAIRTVRVNEISIENVCRLKVSSTWRRANPASCKRVRYEVK